MILSLGQLGKVGRGSSAVIEIYFDSPTYPFWSSIGEPVQLRDGLYGGTAVMLVPRWMHACSLRVTSTGKRLFSGHEIGTICKLVRGGVPAEAFEAAWNLNGVPGVRGLYEELVST